MPEDAEPKPTKAEIALAEVGPCCKKLFVDEYHVAHAAIDVNEHVEVYPIDSSRFRKWARRLIHRQTGIVVDSQTLKDAMGVLAAEAEFDSGKSIPLSVRIASDLEAQSKYYYDLSNEKWEVIEITSDGWRIVNNVTLFRRFNNQSPQVYPSREYTPDIFDRLIKLLLDVNIEEKNKKNYALLMKCYIVYLFIPHVLKPVLMLHGHQGGAKSTLLEKIRMIVDPSVLRTLSFPRNVNELIQQLSHNHVAYYDNISKLEEWSSDELCRAVTGSGSSKRKLWTDDDDIIYNFKRCVGFNGINMAATKADLLDRGLNIHVKRIEYKDYRTPQDINREFDEIHPQLLGCIMDILVKVLKWKQEGKKLNLKLKRMAEFAEYGEIISQHMGNPEGVFAEAYQTNIDSQIEEIIDSSQVAGCLTHWFFENNHSSEWSGTATVLLDILEGVAVDLKINTKTKFWPKAPNSLSRRLNEIATPLKDIGIEIEFTVNDRGKARTITIREISSSSSSSSTDPNQAQDKPKNDDDITSEAKYRNHISSSENDQNRAQKDNDYDDYDDYDILHSVLENSIAVNETPINLIPKPEGPQKPEGPHPVRVEQPERCPDCGRMIDPFDKNIHLACCTGKRAIT